MASPLSGVRSKRRHHNDQAGRMSRKTTLKERKKKGLSMRLNHKLTSNKNNNNPLPRITQKRLTKKSGFCIKGALMTSPRSRGIRDLQKPKKNSSDFDLLSLLEAAKNKDLNPKDMPHTTSACTTPATDSSCSLVDSYLEENRKPVYFREDKGNYFTNEENIKKRKESHSSTENNMFLPGNHWGGNNQRVFMPKETCRNEFSNTHDGSQCFGSLSFKSYESDTNQLPERRTPQSGQRLCSLSSYQKFAVGIVEALVSEKKKQFPSHDWLCNAEKDLQNIYHKTHNIALSNEQKSFDEIYQIQSKMSHGHIIETTNKKVSENIDKVKKTMYHRDNDEDINIGQSDKQRHEEKVFREMVVEAWVKAIPDDNKTEDHKKISTARCIDNPQHVSHAVHKGEFLEKIKKNLCGIKSSNVATQNTEPTLHVGGVCDDGYSPYPPPPTDLNSHNPGYKFVGSKTTWKNKQKSFHPLETGCNFEWNAIKHQHQQRLQSSWIPWFMGKRADNTCGDNKSPSFSPRFSLESLPLKYNCVDKGADIKECVDFHKKQRNHIPPVWSRCPKLQKLDKNEAVFIKPVNVPIEDKFCYGMSTNKDLELFKFSPRLM